MLLTAKCVIAATIDGDAEFSVPAIAERTGLTMEAVKAVLNSPTYQGLMREEMQQIVAHTLVRGVQTMANIINDGEAKNSDRIAAHRAIVQTYEAMRGNLERAPEPAAADFDQLLKNLRKSQTKVTVTDASPR